MRLVIAALKTRRREAKGLPGFCISSIVGSKEGLDVATMTLANTLGNLDAALDETLLSFVSCSHALSL